MAYLLAITGVLQFIFLIWVYRRGDVFVRIGITLIVAILIPDAWVLIRFFYPETEITEYDLWLSSDYHEKLNALWYFYGIGSYLSRIIFVVVVTNLAWLVSHKLFKVGVTVVIYYIIQFVFWLYNKNTSVWMNYLVYLLIISIIVHLIIPNKHPSKYRIIIQDCD